MKETTFAPEWTTRPERSTLPLLKFAVWLALRLGRRLARVLLYPACLYFLLSSPSAARNSRRYLTRSLGRTPRLTDVFTHFLTFGTCVLDRVFLLNQPDGRFNIDVHGEDIVRQIERQGRGCLLFGAHFGSFEAARVAGRREADLPISLLMYENNARKMRDALATINPRLAAEIIGLGRPDSLIKVVDRLARGHFIGVLADRDVGGKDLARMPFLSAPALFPRGPFRLALLLKRPVVMMLGVYRGGNRYDVVFETLAEAPEPQADGALWLETAMRRYVDRLEHHCREAPYNWFNFYDFWA